MPRSASGGRFKCDARAPAGTASNTAHNKITRVINSGNSRGNSRGNTSAITGGGPPAGFLFVGIFTAQDPRAGYVHGEAFQSEYRIHQVPGCGHLENFPP